MTRGHIIGVAGAAGGVGASCLAVGLAVRAAAEGRSAVVIDGRPASSGLDVIAGVEYGDGLGWAELARAHGEIDGDGLLARLPGQGGFSVLTHARQPDVRLPTPQTVGDIAVSLASACDLCVIDLDRPGGWGQSLWAAVDDVVLVVPNHVPGLAASSVVAPAVVDLAPRAWLCLRQWSTGERARGAGVRAAEWTTAEYVSEALGVPLAGLMPHDPKVESHIRRGRAPGDIAGPFQRSCDTLLKRLHAWSSAA